MTRRRQFAARFLMLYASPLLLAAVLTWLVLCGLPTRWRERREGRAAAERLRRAAQGINPNDWR